MTSPRVLNLTNGYWYKRSRAERAVHECAVAWVEHGVSVRSLTLAEAIVARKQQIKASEPLPCAEIPGLKYEPCTAGMMASRSRAALVWGAHDFVRSVTGAAN